MIKKKDFFSYRFYVRVLFIIEVRRFQTILRGRERAKNFYYVNIFANFMISPTFY